MREVWQKDGNEGGDKIFVFYDQINNGDHFTIPDL